MSLANKNTFFASGSGAQTYHIGSGRIFGIIASPAEASVQTVTLYDDVTTSAVLLALNIPGAGPVTSIFFPADKPLVFSEGLTIDPGNCDVLLLLAV